MLSVVPGVLGQKMRGIIYSNKLLDCGKNLSVPTGCLIGGFKNILLGDNVRLGLNNQIYASGSSKERIEIGDNVSFNSNVMINADIGGNIKIGSNVLMGPNVVVRASNHMFKNKTIPIAEQGHLSGSIIIEDDVWIGANVVILPNVSIGKGSVIGAGAVVTKDIDCFSIAVGVPAKVIDQRK